MDRFSISGKTLGTRIAAVGVALGGIALLAAMALTVADIVMRNLGFTSILGLVELTGMAVIFVACLGLSYCFLISGHVVVDIATAGLSERVLRKIDAAWTLVGGLALSALTYQVGLEGLRVSESGETTPALAWSLLVYFVPAVVGFGAAAVTCFALGFKGLLTPGPDTDDNPLDTPSDTQA
jgi:TRAP-type C4-dicarboxylate transport system permease small subunit